MSVFLCWSGLRHCLVLQDGNGYYSNPVRQSIEKTVSGRPCIMNVVPTNLMKSIATICLTMKLPSDTFFPVGHANRNYETTHALRPRQPHHERPCPERRPGPGADASSRRRRPRQGYGSVGRDDPARDGARLRRDITVDPVEARFSRRQSNHRDRAGRAPNTDRSRTHRGTRPTTRTRARQPNGNDGAERQCRKERTGPHASPRTEEHEMNASTLNTKGFDHGKLHQDNRICCRTR